MVISNCHVVASPDHVDASRDVVVNSIYHVVADENNVVMWPDLVVAGGSHDLAGGYLGEIRLLNFARSGFTSV